MSKQKFNRRAFLRNGTLFLAGSALLPSLAAAEDKPNLRVGLGTDLHHADEDSQGTRYYRETLAKFAEAAHQFDGVDFVVCLGDLIDTAPTLDAEKGYLRRIVKEFSPGKHHFVLGNHCVENLTKPEFLGIVGQEKSYYSFDVNGYHFVVLDACFTSAGAPYGRKNFEWTDSNVPPTELEWLQADLRQSPHKTIVFIHQRLDAEPPMGVKNAPQCRKILEDSGKVLAVLQGHDHKGDYKEISGLHYCTLKAMVEGSGPAHNAYAVLEILPGDAIRITGFREQKSYRW